MQMAADPQINATSAGVLRVPYRTVPRLWHAEALEPIMRRHAIVFTNLMRVARPGHEAYDSNNHK